MNLQKEKKLISFKFHYHSEKESGLWQEKYGLVDLYATFEMQTKVLFF